MLFGQHSRITQKWLYFLLLPLILVACEQFGRRVEVKGGKNDILTLQPGYTALVIDGATSLESIAEAADMLRTQRNVDLRVLRYQKDASDEITDLEIDVKCPNGSLWGSWDKSDWKKNRAILTIQKDLNGESVYWIGTAPISNTKNLKTLKLANMPPLKKGQVLFRSNCASCHHPLQDMTAPALAGVTNRHSKTWIRNFVRHSAQLIAAGDTAAAGLYNRWGKIPMTRFPHLKDYEIDDIFNYVDFYAKTENNPVP